MRFEIGDFEMFERDDVVNLKKVDFLALDSVLDA